jgi:hypothetical protein
MPQLQKGIWNDFFGCRWTYGDLKRIKPTLTDEQCSKVIQRLYDEWDKRVGLNEDVVEMMIDSVLYWEERNKVGVFKV